ncbi:MAG: endolytic transglycosylase MltG [Bacteroidota bacterium]
MKRRLLIIADILLLVVGCLLYETFWAPHSFPGDRFVIVSKGETFSQVIDSLQKAGVIQSRFFLSLAGRLRGYTTRIQIGKYRFRSGMSNNEVLLDLRYGATVEMITVTIPEGMRTTRLAKLLAKDFGIDSSLFMKLVGDSAFIRTLGEGSGSLEGYLLPNTYTFDWQTEEDRIIREMVNQFHKTFNDSLKARARSLGMAVSQVLALASIIEGETSIDSERVLISGVYHNRLKRGMRLQADPTIQYIIGNGPRRLVRSDLQIESAYNTYRHVGLPPGPVNNPGKSAILAALYPKRHKYLYFVANGQGGHKFSKTYAEHEHAVRQFRKWREEQDAMKKEKQVM